MGALATGAPMVPTPLCHAFNVNNNIIIGRNNTDIPIRSNQSYHSTTKIISGTHSQAAQVPAGATNQAGNEVACPDYSSFGPDYEVISDSERQVQPQKKNQLNVRLLSERYEYSEAHLQAASTDGGGPEMCANYEVPINLRQNECPDAENEDYSRLKH